MKNKIMMIALLLLMGAAGRVKAQVDPHFSQYYAYPLWLNPALTGVMNGDLRVGGNYKNQWANVGNGYKTGAISADMRPTDKIGVGLTILNQAAGDAGYNYFSALGSFGYSIAVSADGNQKLSFGVQAGIINRSFDMSKLQFGSQYDPVNGYNPMLPSFEGLSSSNTTVFDANAGVFYYDGDPLKTVNLFGGASVSHLSRPRDPFTTTADGKLPIRFALHGGVRIKAAQNIDLTPNAIFIDQRTAQIKGLGLYSEFKMQNDNGLIAGAMYRFKDAAIANVGYRFNNAIVGVSYDFNTSSFSRATAGAGGLELSISYVFRRHLSEPEPICPRL
ncbi:PorP/SprF family type IX secretion system membrane protein [Mucilaginibacter myungsuensis]|uniref:PorP/SprF family type IX secretion system membrane protein n=1 Tax=Mucilaginibacter myungsuensis TaxID=649104 RepID=A0A929KTG7_9SPHI|nr:PorP/SprF family type IX secretion system membrane protein [Mucilaginibacter myungsuensis]MBE9660867.1 PorP/SprF family type IX secretion system membrane protein [Mucilaginibacter myungsuensis]MDN3600914.1 PorP/SprF family type IX secretion system membrane protein [Mucilaginibacter myungsuensis]